MSKKLQKDNVATEEVMKIINDQRSDRKKLYMQEIWWFEGYIHGMWRRNEWEVIETNVKEDYRVEHSTIPKEKWLSEWKDRCNGRITWRGYDFTKRVKENRETDMNEKRAIKVRKRNSIAKDGKWKILNRVRKIN